MLPRYHRSATTLLILIAICSCHTLCQAASFTSHLSENDRVWIGRSFWGNRLQDWRLHDGRIECVGTSTKLPLRTLHQLTHRLGPGRGELSMQVRTGIIGDPAQVPAGAITGLLVGSGGPRMDPRAAAIIHQWPGPGFGYLVGINGKGQAFIRDMTKAGPLGNNGSASLTPRDAIDRKGWKVHFVDSVETGNSAIKVLDGNPSTIWHTEWKAKKPPHPHEIQIDIGKQQLIHGFAYLPRRSKMTIPKDYVFYLSSDGKQWGQPVAQGSFPDSTTLQRIQITPRTARYFRLVIQNSHGNRPATTIAELYALGPKGKKTATSKLTRENAGGSIQDVTLHVSLKPVGESYRMTVTSRDQKGRQISQASQANIPAERTIGNLALVSHHGGRKGIGFWFRDWQAKGSKLVSDQNATVGPILCTQHTLTDSGTQDGHVLKVTAQLMPISPHDADTVEFQVQRESKWQTIATSQVIAPGWTAPFRIPNWDASRDRPYRVVVQMKETAAEPARPFSWSGTIRKDPVAKESIVVAGFTGNHMNSHRIGQQPTNWPIGMWFPHADLTRRVAMHAPDVLFFSGDQVYEGRSPTFADREHIELDYLYKWYLWCWSYRHLTRDIPTITIPDDHDVYQGNIWGEGGRKSPGRDHHGGYVHPASFIKMVERTQTSHLPDPYDPTPVGQGIGVYYSNMTYGRISLAVLEDRKFKSGCARPEMPPSGTGRPDHFNDPAFDTNALDVPTVKLLGDRQLKFLRDWSADWHGADMKMALSQTVFANLATHHGGSLGYLIADLDSNGWPQTGRKKALAELRRAFALHLAGDQHLATLVQHGIDTWDDANWSFAVPSVANFYPRAWAPQRKGPYAKPPAEDFTGKRRDGFHNYVTVYAASNPGADMGHEPRQLHNNMPGYGIVRLNKKQRTYTVECWPRYAVPGKDAQYEGWPRVIKQAENYGRQPVAWLPRLNFRGAENPVVQIVDEAAGDVVYTLRINGSSYRPRVYRKGSYTVRVTSGTKKKQLRGVQSVSETDAGVLNIDLR